MCVYIYIRLNVLNLIKYKDQNLVINKKKCQDLSAL